MKKVKVRIVDDLQQTSDKLDSLEDSLLYGKFTKGKIAEFWREEKPCEHYGSCSKSHDCTGYGYYLDIKKEHPLCGYAVEELEEKSLSKIEKIILFKEYVLEKIRGEKKIS